MLTLKSIHDRCTQAGLCWLWNQSTTTNGYPRLTLAGAPSQYAHIAAWVLRYGPVPEGHCIHRICGRKTCCNPAHGRPITRAEQNRLAAAAGAWSRPLRILRIAEAAQRQRGKLDAAKVALILSSPLNGAALARQLGMSKSLVSRVRCGKAGKYVGLTAAPDARMTVAPSARGRYEADPGFERVITSDWLARRQQSTHHQRA